MLETTIATVTKMIAFLPESHQERVVEHLRDYIEDLNDELHWNDLFDDTQEQLTSAARQARQQVAANRSKPMNTDEL